MKYVPFSVRRAQDAHSKCIQKLCLMEEREPEKGNKIQADPILGEKNNTGGKTGADGVLGDTQCANEAVHLRTLSIIQNKSNENN